MDEDDAEEPFVARFEEELDQPLGLLAADAASRHERSGGDGRGNPDQRHMALPPHEGEQRLADIFSVVGEHPRRPELAKAMMGARVGDAVVWRRPAGETEVQIIGITYPRNS